MVLSAGALGRFLRVVGLRAHRQLGYTKNFVGPPQWGSVAVPERMPRASLCLHSLPVLPELRSQGFRVPFLHRLSEVEGVPRDDKETTVNSRNMIRVAVLGAACLLAVTAVRAQGAAAGKFAVINVRQAIVTTAEGKQASGELQTQFASRQNELENLNKQINDLRQRLSSGQSTLSDEEKVRLTQQGQRLTQQLDRKNNELQEDLNAAQGEIVDRIGRKMMDVLEKYARENGISAVFDSSAQNSPILFAATSIDITQEIIKLFDQAYPAKGGATTPAAKPAPATPKPATPPATKP